MGLFDNKKETEGLALKAKEEERNELKAFIKTCIGECIDEALKDKLAKEVQVAELIKEEKEMQAKLQVMMPKLERAVNEIAGRVP
jgi:phosphomevalonate kinase